MKFELITLHGVSFSGEVAELALRTASGDIAVLPTHEPLTTIAKAGPVTVRQKNGKVDTFVTFGGIFEVSQNGCTLLSDEAEHSDELIEKEIEEALARAHALTDSAKDKHELAHAQTLVDRHTVRLNVAKLKRHHKSSNGSSSR